MITFFPTNVLIKENSVEAKRNLITKVTIGLCFVICVAFTTACYINDYYLLNVVFSIFSAVYLITYYIFTIQKTYIAKVMLYVSMLVHAFLITAALGDFVQIKIFYIPISIVPILIFSKKEKTTLYVLLILTGLNIILINSYVQFFEVEQIYSAETYRKINNALDTTSMLCMVILSFLFLQLTEAGELELLEANNELSKQKLKEQQTNVFLKEAKEDQERMNVMKDHLFRIISHDLRSPINTIHGLTEVLTNTTLSQDEQIIVTASLKKSAENTTHLLDNLLKWSAFQINNSTQPIIDTINVKVLVNDIFNQLELKIKEKKLKVLMTIDTELSIYADINMLEIVLRNLISNAIKFSYEEHTVSVIAEKQNEELVIKVIDTGIGIPQNIINKLYTNDKSVSRPGTHNEKGTGIGLLLCKNLLENCSGTIDVLSTPSYKTIFTIKLPMNLNRPNSNAID
jgi:signal transduction histidine kinase